MSRILSFNLHILSFNCVPITVLELGPQGETSYDFCLWGAHSWVGSGDGLTDSSVVTVSCRGWQTVACGQSQPVTCFCMTHELTVIFTKQRGSREWVWGFPALLPWTFLAKVEPIPGPLDKGLMFYRLES